MALFRSERGIGRGEVAESRMEAPFFAAFMLFCAIVLLIVHTRLHDPRITSALAVSMLVFGATVVRVEFGVYVLVIAMLLSPELTAGTTGGRGEREVTLRYGDILIVVIFLGVLVKHAFEGRSAFWRPSPINAGIVLYYGVCLWSTALALRHSVPAWDKHDALFVLLKMIEFYLVFILVGNAVRTHREVRRQLTLFFIVALIVCLYCASQIGGEGRLSPPFEQGGTEPNTLGGYLVLVALTALALAFQAPTRKWKFIMFFLAGAAILPFLYALSRASYLAMLAGCIVLGIAGKRYLLLGAVVAVLVLSPYIMPTEVQDRVNYTFQRGSGKQVYVAGRDTGLQVDKSTYERIYVWRKVRFNLGVWPWFGGGVSWGLVLDSQYARVIIETGMVGFAAFLFLQFRMLRTCIQTHRWSGDWVARGLGLGLFATTLALAVHSAGTISFLVVRIMEPFWFLMALVAVCRSLAIEHYWQRVHAQQARAADAAEQPAAPEHATVPA